MKCVSSFALEINMSNYRTNVMSTIPTHEYRLMQVRSHPHSVMLTHEYRLIQVRSHLHSSFSVSTQSWHKTAMFWIARKKNQQTQECIPVGRVPFVAVAVSGWGGGCLPRGVYTFPPVDRMTDACENITFPQLLLRTVKVTSSEIRISNLVTDGV